MLRVTITAIRITATRNFLGRDVTMEVRYLVRNVELKDDLRDYMTEKLEKLEKFFDRISTPSVTLSYKRGLFTVELTIKAGHVVLRGEESDDDLHTAFDKALKNLERRVKRHKEYLQDRGRVLRHLDEDINFGVDFPQPVEKETSLEVIKRKKFDLEVMTEEEAVLQMELLGHDFFVFKNHETGDVNVLYKRKDGNLGVLEPQA